MLTASAKFLPAVSWFLRQIAPSVVATLIAALVIAGYNRAFSGHLAQPRMAAPHATADSVARELPLPARSAAMRPATAPVTEAADIFERMAELERISDKNEGREAAKDQGKIKVAEVAPAAAAPVMVPVAQEPPPVIAAKPMVTVPDRPAQHPAYEAQAHEQAAEQAPPRSPGVLGTIVNTLTPSSLFARAREFGDRIEAAGNDILPSIRQ